MTVISKPFIGIFVVIACLISSTIARAGSIDVSYTYSGAPGDYLLNFKIENNLTSQPETFVSLFGVDLTQFGADLSNDVAVIAAPVGFSTDYSDPSSPWNNYRFGYGGRDFNWINHWNAIGTPLRTGTSLSGFLVHTNAQVLPTTVNWFAFAFSVAPSPKPPVDGLAPQISSFSAEDSSPQPFYDSTTPSSPGSDLFVTTLGYEGGAEGSPHVVPEPASLTLAAFGILGTLAYGFSRRRSSRI